MVIVYICWVQRGFFERGNNTGTLKSGGTIPADRDLWIREKMRGIMSLEMRVSVIDRSGKED